jgi:hypothetical protein
LLLFEIDNVHCNKPVIEHVPGIKVNISGFNSRADAESKMSYSHGANSQWFRSYDVLKQSNKLERKEEHCALY